MKIIVSMPLTERRRKMLEEAARGAEFAWLDPDDPARENGGALSAATDAEILFGSFSEKELRAAKQARWIQAQSAGVDALLKPGLVQDGVVITSAVGAYGPAVSEHMLALTLSLLKKLPALRDSQLKSEWTDVESVGTLFGANVLVLGFGNIGTAYARHCAELGAHVTGLRRHVDGTTAGAEAAAGTGSASGACAGTGDEASNAGSIEVRPISELDELLKSADVVAMCLPGTSETYHIMDKRRLSLMRPGAYLVNCGRGTAVDPGALAEALKAGTIAGAALDVTEPEPLPPESPLWREPRCLITPHTAGGLRIEETCDRIFRIAAGNLKRYLNGEPLRNTVKR